MSELQALAASVARYVSLEARARPRRTAITDAAAQSRGRWMIPAYKAVLYTSIGSSLYMMGRLVFVRCPRLA